MGNNHGTAWTPTVTKAVVERYLAGEGPTEIAGAFGMTRNQVLAKMVRLGHVRKKPTDPTSTARTARSAPSTPKRISTVPAGSGAFILPPTSNAPQLTPAQRAVANAQAVAEYVEPATDDVGAVKLADLAAHHCRWPIGDVLSPGFAFCGAHKRDEGGPYCKAHHKKSVAAVQPGRGNNDRNLLRTARRCA